MKYIKLISFILIAILFIVSVYAYFFEIYNKFHDSGSLGFIMVTLLTMAVSGIITLLILLFSSKHYFYIFLGLVSLLLVFVGIKKVIAYYNLF